MNVPLYVYVVGLRGGSSLNNGVVDRPTGHRTEIGNRGNLLVESTSLDGTGSRTVQATD